MNILSYLKDVACFNQGALVQYSYLVSKQHMNLKDCVRDKPEDTDTIYEKFKSLDKFLNDEFEKVCLRNFEFIKSYFLYEMRKKPRICLKATYKDNIVCVFRNSHVEYNIQYPSTSNSGFQFIQDTGQYFLCNNIPEAVQLGFYRNPRLNMEKVAGYSTNIFGNLLCRNEGVDKKWVDCWNYDGNDVDPSSCYKSTLIVPLTLWNNELSEEYVCASCNGKSMKIFGYLCLDYTDVNFFESSDVYFLYIMADLLSLFVITRRNYTVDSKTYQCVQGMFGLS